MATLAPRYFTFLLGTSRDPSQTKVTVFEPIGRQQSRGGPAQPNGLTPGSRTQRDVFRQLLHRLNTGHIQRDPNPTITLVSEGSHRIDSQPATVVYRNLHYQYQTNSYSALTVEKGAELCFVVGFENVLLRYIKGGLSLSFENTDIFDMNVKIERKFRDDKKWKAVPYSADDVDKVSRGMNAKMAKNKIQKQNQMKSGKNTEKQRTNTDAIDRVAAAIERIVGEDAPGARPGIRNIATVAMLLGTYVAAERQRRGSWPGAITKVLDGQRDFYTAEGIDEDRLVKEIKKALDLKPKNLTEADLQRLREEQKQLRKEMAASAEESPIYGTHVESYFDEFGLADLEDIQQVRVRSGKWINGIQMVYRSQRGAVHGGDGGVFETLDLEEDEMITSVSGTLVRDQMLTSLTFTTCFGKEKSFGSPRGDEFTFEMTDGSYLGAIKGFAKDCGKASPNQGYDEKVNMLLAVGFIPKC